MLGVWIPRSLREVTVTALMLAGLQCSAAPAASPIGQNSPDLADRVQTVLKAQCYQCHGGGQDAGGLRLDTRALLLKGGVSGAAILPGRGAQSLLMARLRGQGGKPRMPLGFAPLTPDQIALLSQWIDGGAAWPVRTQSRHWAYVRPIRPPLPRVNNIKWVRNPIDNFILARLEREGMKPSSEADRVTLLRRVTLDLTGLPPTPHEVDAFLVDRSPAAYDKVVDRLLSSPHYGERMALPWLDAARFADSNGFQQDGDTYQFVWRDWVVRAMNANMSFDQFTIQQLAGDLLPHPTADQKIATGFNRCNMLNGEGGAIAEEQRNFILFDRVDVTATTWLAATLACAQCHDHKYDPFTQRDYYSFMAFFNNVPESGVPPGGGQYRVADPWIRAPNQAQQATLNQFDAEVKDAKDREARFERDHEAEISAAQANWESAIGKVSSIQPKLGPWYAAGPFTSRSFEGAYDTAFAPEKQIDLAAVYQAGAIPWTAHPEWVDGKPHDLAGENAATYLYREIIADTASPLSLSLGSDDAIKVWLNGSPVLADKVTRGVAPDEEKVTIKLRPGKNHLLMKIVNGGGATGFYFGIVANGLPDNINTILKSSPSNRPVTDAAALRVYFLANQPPAAIKSLTDRVSELTKARSDYESALPQVMVMSDTQPRKTHVLQRGNYEMPAAEVTPAVPASLPPLPRGAPPNRLGLAMWLVSPENPLTARVQVNRYWQLFFGTGLVKTSENLGTQSEPPSNPELLDWLAVEFRESGWNVKHIQRLMVTSAAYRQSSKVTRELLTRDPENRMIARGVRFRLPSLILRDVALASSGLLDPSIGGKPVYPYQPTGIWDGLAITNERDFTYPESRGKDLYRRSLYTFWRRTVAPSNMFDASVRNTCKVRLAVTSTPLHALTTLNDITWVEAGRALAAHVMKEAGPTPDGRLSEAFRRVCARRPDADELRILRRSLARAVASFKADPPAAAAYLKTGESPVDKELDPVQCAAYAVVCLAIYNLDEALTRE